MSSFYSAVDFDLTCELSPKSRALSTIMTAAVGSIIAGVSGGYKIAFFTAWVCWFSSLRILFTALWQLYQVSTLQPIEGGDQFVHFYSHVPILGNVLRRAQRNGRLGFQTGEKVPPTVFGWIGWAWATLYTPVSQILWIVGNWKTASGGLYIVRAISIGITALPLTIDTKARYGAVLERRIGKWARYIFSFVSAISCLILSILSILLLVRGISTLDVPTTMKVMIPAVYVFVMLFWTVGSFVFQMPHDEIDTPHSLKAYAAGLGTGLFAIPFVAAPALALMVMADSSPGVGLGQYVQCASVAVWRKFIAIFP